MTAQRAGIVLSVLMPAYNEEESIGAAVSDVQRLVLGAVPGSELIAVNDGSRDRTGQVLDQLAAADSRIRAIHQANRGHGGALLTALDAARGDVVFLIDSDRQMPLDDFPSAWRHLEAGQDAVFGVRLSRQDPAIRRALSRVIRMAVRLLFKADLADANVPYKLVRRSLWQSARQYIPDDTLAPSLFLAVFVRCRGFAILELPITHRQRATGVVSIRRLKLLKFCAKGFRQLLDFRRRLNDVQ